MKIIESIPEICCTIILIFTMVVSCYAIFDRIGDEHSFAVGFCLDKEGMYNITDYGYELVDYSDNLNCSNKEHPTAIDTAISTR